MLIGSSSPRSLNSGMNPRHPARRGFTLPLAAKVAITLPCLGLVFLGNTQPPQPADRTGQPWTTSEARANAEHYNDAALWNMKFLRNDVATMVDQKEELASLPFPQAAFNTPDYERTGRVMPGLSISPIVPGDGLVGTVVGVHRMLDPKDVPAGKQWHEVVVTEPLLAIVASGTEPLTFGPNQALSRSHPHYLFQGSFTSKHGQVRWTAVRMADGSELAIINGRVLELKQGNLVLVRQHPDGSIRVHQHLTRLEPARGEELRTSIPLLLKQPDLQRVIATGQ